MKSTNLSFKAGVKAGKPSLKRVGTFDKHTPLPKRSANTWRIVQSVRAGHVRGGHGFH